MNQQNKDNAVLGLKPDYEKAESDLLLASLKRTYTERFKMMTTLMKRSLMLKKAQVTHKSMNR